ncbi:hypothetical protein SDC9_88195 [bioreactor metagenome]|uniref:Uncharacterized protein n=1 Tax=bioreactor metagenome TaxID=1076179 RepID=A0A644ZKX5_9ZZZZ
MAEDFTVHRLIVNNIEVGTQFEPGIAVDLLPSQALEHLSGGFPLHRTVEKNFLHALKVQSFARFFQLPFRSWDTIVCSTEEINLSSRPKGKDRRKMPF